MRKRSGSESIVTASHPLLLRIDSHFFTFHYRTTVVVRICKLRDLSRFADSFVDRRWKRALRAKRSQRIWRIGDGRERNHFLTSDRRVGVSACIVITVNFIFTSRDPFRYENLTRMHGYITFLLLACVYTQCASSTKICHRGSSRSNRYVLFIISLLIRVTSVKIEWRHQV